MKVSEVYKILESQPNRKFKFVKSNGLQEIPIGSIIYLDREGYITNEYNHALCGLNVDSEYELIPEPVDFITAIKAYVEGKTIKSETDTVQTTYVPNECCCLGYKLIDENRSPIATEEILKGKWYIED